ncbi:response regulator [Paenibacillus luteus]|uniref:response regulator n=1 Tax=Paenibacillus luteus TaxID=2545753 RepID=UPI001F4F7FD9|nr:response regulator [Paenibacillus luteus]
MDDEMFIAEGIKSSVNWERLGFVGVFVAYNLRQAKEVFDNHPIDLLICDIEMPEGNGLELVEWVRESYSQTECIFLTAHPNFNYAKRAIQLNSFEYLLKPIPKNELEDAVIRAIEKIRKEKESATIKTETFWRDVLSQAIPSVPSRMEEVIRKLNIPYSKSMSFLPVLIWVQHWDKSFSSRDTQIMKYALRNALEESFIQDNASSEFLWIDEESILVIMPNVNGEKEELPRLRRRIRTRCESFVEACNKYFYCHLSCYIGTTALVHEIRDMVESLINFQKSYVNFTDRVILLEDGKRKEFQLSMPPFHIWSEMYKRDDKTKLIEESWLFLESWKRIEGLDVKWITHFYQSFLQMIMATLQQQGFRAEDILSVHLSPGRIQVATRSVKDLQEWMLDVLENAFVHTKEGGANEKVVEKIKKYISLHIDEDLSRQCISDYIGLSPDYIVKVFKKETGKSITDYILQERINLAKELLKNTDITITNIAMAVGFSTNFPYFSTIFKKQVLMTPQEYRKNHHKE